MELDQTQETEPKETAETNEVEATDLGPKPELNGAKTLLLKELPLVKPKVRGSYNKVMRQLKKYAKQAYGPVSHARVTEARSLRNRGAKPIHAEASIQFVKREGAQKLWDTAERDEKGKWCIEVELEYCGKQKLVVDTRTFPIKSEPKEQKVFTGAKAQPLVLKRNRKDLFIGRLPVPAQRRKADFQLIEQQIKTDLESKFGPVSAVRCPVRHKRKEDEFIFAFVDFESQESANKLINAIQPDNANQICLSLPYAGEESVQCYVDVVKRQWRVGPHWYGDWMGEEEQGEEEGEDGDGEEEEGGEVPLGPGGVPLPNNYRQLMARFFGMGMQDVSDESDEESINGFLNEENMETEQINQNGVN